MNSQHPTPADLRSAVAMRRKAHNLKAVPFKTAEEVEMIRFDLHAMAYGLGDRNLAPVSKVSAFELRGYHSAPMGKDEMPKSYKIWHVGERRTN